MINSFDTTLIFKFKKLYVLLKMTQKFYYKIIYNIKNPTTFLLYIIVLPRRLISTQFLSLTELSMQQYLFLDVDCFFDLFGKLSEIFWNNLEILPWGSLSSTCNIISNGMQWICSIKIMKSYCESFEFDDIIQFFVTISQNWERNLYFHIELQL